jgi:hypothetical protein
MAISFAAQCKNCEIAIEKNRPVEKDFRKYIPYFVTDIPDERCAKAGRATYHDVKSLEIVEYLQLWNRKFIY